jgi:hypothetical protein
VTRIPSTRRIPPANSATLECDASASVTPERGAVEWAHEGGNRVADGKRDEDLISDWKDSCRRCRIEARN